jgi:Na+/proline symporter/signal transduction histidine kinase/CheY-like chemotaxis protein
MLSAGQVWALLAAYAGLLFVIAWAGERFAGRWLARRPARIAVYGLSFAIYFTSWTFFGAVGTAAVSGWAYLPIFLGPLLLMAFGFPIIERLVRKARAVEATSLADFVSVRYGKSETVAALVTIACVITALPYLALQLKAISESVALVAPVSDTRADEWGQLLVPLMLGFYAILFGTRRLDSHEHNHGLMLAIAFESLVKLAVMLTVGLFAWQLLGTTPAAAAPASFHSGQFGLSFMVLTLIAGLAFMTLPRDFHAMAVECNDPDDLRPARFIMIGYFVLTALLVVPITLAGAALLGGSNNDPDYFIIALPLASDAPGLALLVLIGGFSAATSMVLVATLAVAIMVSNHLIVPNLVRVRQIPSQAMPTVLLWVRRITILALIGAATLFERWMASEQSLAGLGTLSFALVAQLAPALLLGLFWRRAHQSGAVAGITTGMGLWAVMLMVPVSLGYSLTAKVPGLPIDLLSLGVLVSLGTNVLLVVLMSRRARETFLDRDQAALFSGRPVPVVVEGPAAKRWRLGDLRALVGRFAGESAATVLDSAEAGPLRAQRWAGEDDVAMAERQLARAIGAASARILIDHGPETGLDSDEVASLLDATSSQLRFSRALMEATLDHMPQAVNVVDDRLRLVAWNSRYASMFGFPDTFLEIGRPLEDVIELHGQRGEIGDPFVAAQVCAALDAMRNARPYTFERNRPDGTVWQVSGNPMPQGYYVNSFTDITHAKRTEAALLESRKRLEQANALLEKRVADRTRELADAKSHAEALSRSKTRFLAAASHDLLQPLNAARLFTLALADDLQSDAHPAQGLAAKIERSIGAADQLLRALLDVSKLDAGGLTPMPEPFALQSLFDELAEEFGVIAARRGLRLLVAPTIIALETDRRLLRQVLQNFLSNALKYTHTGGVVMGVRRRGGKMWVDVVDTGPGIPAEKREDIFREFHRLPDAHTQDQPGLGLGLAIVDRAARLLELDVQVESALGRGSRFSIALPGTIDDAVAEEPVSADLRGVRILCIDDDGEALSALSLVLAPLGASLDLVRWPHDVRADMAEPDVLIVDFHLARGVTGPKLAERLAMRWGRQPPTLVVSGDDSDTVVRAVRRAGLTRLDKPVQHGLLVHALTGLLKQAAE